MIDKCECNEAHAYMAFYPFISIAAYRSYFELTLERSTGMLLPAAIYYRAALAWRIGLPGGLVLGSERYLCI